MRITCANEVRRTVAVLLITTHLALYSGCATLAHRSSVTGQQMRVTSNCDGTGDVCPWLAADAGLLLLGVVPGVVALIVDFGTGAWHHIDDEQVRTASDEVTSTNLLFDRRWESAEGMDKKLDR